MRDLLMLATMLALVPIAISNTTVAYLLWCWTGLAAINSYLFGFMMELPYVQIFALIALALVLVKQDKKSRKFKFQRTEILFVVFLVHALFVAIFAYDGLPRNQELALDIVKTLLFSILMPVLINNRMKLHALVIVVVLGLGIHGVMDGVKFLASGGAHTARGIAKFGDNNYEALALATTMPLIFYATRYSANKLVKIGLAAVSFLLLLAIIATGSRGGLITLIALALWIAWHSKRKTAWILTFIVVGSLALTLAPDSWTARMHTIKDAGEDTSFMTRVAVWKKSTAIALENPIFGGGFYAAQSPMVSERFRNAQGLMGFIETPDPGRYAAHSIYFQVMGDMGFVGFGIYLCMLINTFVLRLKIQKKVQGLNGDLSWATDLANMLGASMCAFMVGGALLSAAYFEIPFIVMAAMSTLHQILSRNVEIIDN